MMDDPNMAVPLFKVQFNLQETGAEALTGSMALLNAALTVRENLNAALCRRTEFAPDSQYCRRDLWRSKD
jgi:hypothetical protein